MENASVSTSIPTHPTNPKCENLKMNLLNKKKTNHLGLVEWGWDAGRNTSISLI
jgi:hypothetical protein